MYYFSKGYIKVTELEEKRDFICVYLIMLVTFYSF
jgi:hypothetical protein